MSTLSLQISFVRTLSIIAFACFFAWPFQILAQDTGDVDADVSVETAPVQLDGHTLYHVRGITSYSAEKRASVISRRISEAAASGVDSVYTVPFTDYVKIMAGTFFIMNVYDADAAVENIHRDAMAAIIAGAVDEALKRYDYERSRPVVLKNISYALAAFAVMLIVLLIFRKLLQRLQTSFENLVQANLKKVEHKSFKLISSGQMWPYIQGVIRFLKVVIIIIVVSAFLNYILSLFPWTHGIAAYVVKLFTRPVMVMLNGFIGFLPDFVFLFITFIITRYILKLTRLLFKGVAEGAFVLENFEPEWAMPTFRIVRTLIIAFAIIIAYPYIPGSDTDAFKGVSVFLGILLSLGSSSFIGNLIAGYSMTYRSAFKTGDRIMVDELVGFVEEQKLLVTRLRSVKNEEIIIPNSVLLNSNIINYSSRARDRGLILHTTVGIGYSTPWRMVEAMLKEAAARTSGLSKIPEPYVLQKSLGEFYITYEINAFCHDVSIMHLCYNELHHHILDVFNENNIQIMTPAYEGDPEIPKVVPKENWETPVVKGSTPH